MKVNENVDSVFHKGIEHYYGRTVCIDDVIECIACSDDCSHANFRVCYEKQGWVLLVSRCKAALVYYCF